MHDPNPAAPTGEHREISPERLDRLEGAARLSLAAIQEICEEDPGPANYERLVEANEQLALISAYRTRPYVQAMSPKNVNKAEERAMGREVLEAVVAKVRHDFAFRQEIADALVEVLEPVMWGYLEATITAREGELQASWNHAYWYRRTERAETALEPFAWCVREFDAGRLQNPLWAIALHDYRNADAVLQERRSDGVLNLEDTVRDHRQGQVAKWLDFVFEDRMTDDRWIAKRFLECALGVYFAYYPATVTPSDYTPKADANRLVDVVRQAMPDSVEADLGATMLWLMGIAERRGVKAALCERTELAGAMAIPPAEHRENADAKKNAGL